MSDEAATGFSETPERPGHPAGGDGFRSPLQARADFIENWDWKSVVSINRGACERGGAQHGLNSETGKACAEEWESLRPQRLSLLDVFDRLRYFHRRAPFLYFLDYT